MRTTPFGPGTTTARSRKGLVTLEAGPGLSIWMAARGISTGWRVAVAAGGTGLSVPLGDGASVGEGGWVKVRVEVGAGEVALAGSGEGVAGRDTAGVACGVRSIRMGVVSAGSGPDAGTDWRAIQAHPRPSATHPAARQLAMIKMRFIEIQISALKISVGRSAR